MTKDSDLSAEVAALRQEMAELRAERARRAEAQPRASSASSEDPADVLPNEISAAIEQITDAVKDFTEDAEAEFTEHPVAFLAGSFMLGMVVGLLLRR